MKHSRLMPPVVIIAAVVGALLWVATAYRPFATPAMRLVAEQDHPTGPARIVPKPTIVFGVCEAERQRVVDAEAEHRYAYGVLRTYESLGKSVSGASVLEKEYLVLVAVSRLNQANYDWAQCLLREARPRPARAGCDSLALELNRRAAEVRVLERRMAVAQSLVDSAMLRTEKEKAQAMLDESQPALDRARIALALWRLLVNAAQRLGICGGYDFGRVACDAPPSGADHLALGGGELDEPTACAVPSAPASGVDEIDSDEEWLAAYDEWCDADPDCGAVAPTDIDVLREEPVADEASATGPGT